MKISSQLANNFDYCSAEVPPPPNQIFFAALPCLSELGAPFDCAQDMLCAFLRELIFGLFLPPRRQAPKDRR